VDVDAPVRALSRALVADGAVRLLERDHPAGARREVGLLLRVLLCDRGSAPVLERAPEPLHQAEAGGLGLRLGSLPDASFVDRHDPPRTRPLPRRPPRSAAAPAGSARATRPRSSPARPPRSPAAQAGQARATRPAAAGPRADADR